MKHPLIPAKPETRALPEEDSVGPLLAALAESEQHLQARIRQGLNRHQFATAHALHDALQACQEVVQACRPSD